MTQARSTSAPAPDPRTEYTARREARARAATAARARQDRYANLRLVLFLAWAAGVWLLARSLPLWMLLSIPGAAFAGLVRVHARARATRERADRAVRHYDRSLARLDLDFDASVPTGEEWLHEDHPYATHLDVLGEGSLFQAISTARTHRGRETLARWLLEPAPPEEVRRRQEAARELTDALALREDLAALDTEVVHALASRDVVAWGAAPPALPSGGPRRVAALILAGGAVVAGIALPWIGSPPLAWILVLELGFWWSQRKAVARVVEAVEGPGRALRLLEAALQRLERERFESERLRAIEAALGDHDPPASERLAALLRRVDMLEWRRNQMFMPLAAPLLWGTNFAFAIERWRQRHGVEIAGWIDAVGELEALLDLGGLAYERPDHAFPDVRRGPARFEGVGLAHPLLLDCTPNDVALDAESSLLVVTGSNMSGKSTLLRTVGVSAVLAQAGAPARADTLRMSPLSVGASIRTLDSLVDGRSRFYAEIHAIRRATDAAEHDPPGLFLLDELLHGTNSEDRRIGADAIVRAFLARGAIGIVTTHDLALARIADELGRRARNAHFDFRLEEGELAFDYRLRPGVVQSGNALEIMRSAGLDV